MKHLCQNFFIVLFISRDFTKRNLNSFRGDRVETVDPSFDFHIVFAKFSTLNEFILEPFRGLGSQNRLHVIFVRVRSSLCFLPRSSMSSRPFVFLSSSRGGGAIFAVFAWL